MGIVHHQSSFTLLPLKVLSRGFLVWHGYCFCFYCFGLFASWCACLFMRVSLLFTPWCAILTHAWAQIPLLLIARIPKNCHQETQLCVLLSTKDQGSNEDWKIGDCAATHQCAAGKRRLHNKAFLNVYLMGAQMITDEDERGRQLQVVHLWKNSKLKQPECNLNHVWLLNYHIWHKLLLRMKRIDCFLSSVLKRQGVDFCYKWRRCIVCMHMRWASSMISVSLKKSVAGRLISGTWLAWCCSLLTMNWSRSRWGKGVVCLAVTPGSSAPELSEQNKTDQLRKLGNVLFLPRPC